jgi:hypothetical protein
MASSTHIVRDEMTEPIEIDDAIVLLLGAESPGLESGEIRGVTRLEKLVFLLERETSSKEWLAEDAKFEAYNFGPFSQRIYQAVDTLAAARMIDDSTSSAPDDIDTWEEREGIGLSAGALGRTNVRDPYTTRDFRLTERGWRYYEALLKSLSPHAIQELRDFKSKFAALPLRQLVRYVYLRYDEFTTKSIIRDDILGTE